MTTLVLKNFSGELPNVPDYKLPDANAQQALNCDFAQNDLRPLRGGTLIKTMTNTVRGIYTEEGTNFYTWPIETFAAKGPVLNDTFGRMYYMNANGFKVAPYSGAGATGGEPATSYVVGVPQPTVAPTLVLKLRSALPDYPSISVTTTVWYELNGKKYQEGAMTSFVVVAPWKKYTFTPPTRTLYNSGQEATSTYESAGENTVTVTTEPVAPTGTPPDAKLTAQIIIKDTTNANKVVKKGIDNIKTFGVLCQDDKAIRKEYENYKWKTMPQLMLMYRAAAFFGRLYAPEIMMGMHAVEEISDVQEAPKAVAKLNQIAAK